MNVWTATPASLDDEAQESAAWRILSEAEQARAERLIRNDDRRSFIAAHALLRLAISHITGQAPQTLAIGAEPKGRPTLEADGPSGQRLHLSLSHTLGCVAAAVSADGPIGVDVEAADRLAPDPARFANRHFHAREAADVIAATGEAAARRAISIWCLKEAYAKARGEGLRIPTQATMFRVRDRSVEAFTLPGEMAGETGNWRFGVFTVQGDHVLAVASSVGSVLTNPVDATGWLRALSKSS